MIREEIWWPDDKEIRSTEMVVEGSNQHGHKRINPQNEHIYTLKQTRERVIWACACGRTLSRRKDI